MGTRSPVDYYELALAIQLFSRFVWLFRDPDKWSFLIVLAYSFLIGIVSYKIFSFTRKENVYGKKRLVIASAFSIFLIGTIFLYSYPFYKTRFQDLSPVLLPTEFDSLNTYLSGVTTEKIFFIPYPLKETEWKRPSNNIGNIYQTHSIKPSIEGTEYNFLALNYYNYLVKSITENRSKNIGNLIYPLGTSYYVIFHNDTWNRLHDSYDLKNINLLTKLYFLEDIKNIASIGFYKIFKVGGDNSTMARQINVPFSNTKSLYKIRLNRIKVHLSFVLFNVLRLILYPILQ